VTGATGFLGRYLVDELIRRGAHVVGVVRRPNRVPELLARGVEMRRADLGDREALTEAFRGCTAILANAALFSVGRFDWEEHREANLEGTENVAHAARGAGVRRIVHISSVGVYRRGLLGGGTLDEQAPLLRERDRTPWNAYAVSKALAERRARELADRFHQHLTVVRPGPIYGAHDPNLTSVLHRVFSMPLVVAPRRFRLPLVYAGDVAEATVSALAHRRTVGEVYNVAGPADRSLYEISRDWERAGGRIGGVRVPIPIPVTFSIDSSRAREELNFEARPIDAGLEETFRREPALAS
jgi:nucleoside-diphosphate-sugar epimerase